MLPAFVFLVLLFSVLFLILELCFGSNLKIAKSKLTFEVGNGNRNIDPELLVHLPQLHTWKGMLWLVLFGERKITSFLMYVGQLHTLVDLKLWKARFTFINDFQLGKELFKNAIFCGKPPCEALIVHGHGNYGIICSYGETWKAQRKFCGQHLKQFGFGTKSMEALIQNEVEQLLESWSAKNGERFSPNKDFYIPVISSLWLLLTGERVLKDDQKLVPLVHKAYGDLWKTTKFPEMIIMNLQIKLEYINKLVKWIPIFPGIKAFQKSTDELRTYFQSIINSRKQTLDLDMDTIPSNFVDAYLKKIQETKDPKSDFFGDLGETHLRAVMMDFFIAGGDTTANMLAWAMLQLIRYPEVQEKIRNEIDTVVGTDRQPLLQDRANCPYTEAFLWEVLRCDPVAAGSLPHAPLENTNIGPYKMETNTALYLNIYSIHYDPKIWGDPHNFRPERFLSQDGKSLIKHEAVCSFSLGLRRCVGEQSARDNMFLFVSAICQRFVLKPDPFSKHPLLVGNKKSSLHVPEDFWLIASDRLDIPKK